jgi:uncharacterized membrane protein (UPF0127 family)
MFFFEKKNQKTFIFLAALLAWGRPAGAVDQGQARLPTQKLSIISKSGTRHDFMVEIAATAQQQEIGEMFRTFIPPNEGMFFDWGSPRDVPMWMKNCPVPDDMVFIGEDGVIKTIAENTVPESEATIDPGQPVRATLELQGGITAKLGIEVGDRVSGIIFK